MKATIPEKIFMFFNYTIITLLSLVCLYPVIYVMSASFSAPADVLSGAVVLFPVNFTVDSYKMLLKDGSIYIAYLNSIYYVVVGTVYSLAMNIMIAYPLSKTRLMGRTAVSLFIATTIWFTGGMIPFYLLIKNLGLMNSRLVMILPFACTTYYIILLRTFFASIPISLEESAKIDGAGELTILSRIYLPLSVAPIATIALYIIVGKWNAYFWASVLLRDDYKIPLQVLLRNMVVRMNVDTAGDASAGITNISQQTMIYATMVLAMIPMLMLYPFVQKHFVKGIMVGGIKG